MTHDDLESSISQYLDGTLAEGERSALERRLAEDAEARVMLDEYRRLDAVLKSAPLPDVRWELLAQSISAAVEQSVEERAATTYRIPAWVRTFAPLALAASVLVASGLGIRAYLLRPGSANNIAPQVVHIAQEKPQQVATSDVAGPQADRAEGPAQVDVAIGPAHSGDSEPLLAHYSDEVLSRPSHVSVASGVVPAHEDEPLQYDMQ